MNRLNNILTCVLILLVLFVANGGAGNYLLSLSNGDDDSPDIDSAIFRDDHKLLTMLEKIQELPQLTLQTFFVPIVEVTVPVSLLQSSSPLSTRD